MTPTGRSNNSNSSRVHRIGADTIRTRIPSSKKERNEEDNINNSSFEAEGSEGSGNGTNPKILSRDLTRLDKFSLLTDEQDSEMPEQIKKWQQKAPDNIQATKLRRYADSAINVTITLAIVVQLLIPALIIPTLLLGGASTIALFVVAKKKAENPHPLLDKKELDEVNKDNFVKTKKVLTTLMFTSLAVVLLSVFLFIVEIPLISAFVIANIPIIFLAVLGAKILLDIPMQYFNRKELDQQLLNIDSKICELYEHIKAEHQIDPELEIERTNKLKPSNENSAAKNKHHSSLILKAEANDETTTKRYETYRQFLLDQAKTHTTHTVLEFLFGARLLAMSLISLAGFVLLPISPFIVLALATVYAAIAIVNEIFIRRNPHADVVQEIDPEQGKEAKIKIQKLHKIGSIENKYNTLINITRAAIVSLALYSTLLAITPVATFLGVSTTLAVVLVPALLGSFCLLAIAGLIIINRLEKKKLEAVIAECNTHHDHILNDDTHTSLRYKSHNSTQEYSNRRLHHKLWISNIAVIVIFQSLLLLAGLAFLATPVGIAISCILALYLIVSNLLGFYLIKRRKGLRFQHTHRHGSLNEPWLQPLLD